MYKYSTYKVSTLYLHSSFYTITLTFYETGVERLRSLIYEYTFSRIIIVE